MLTSVGRNGIPPYISGLLMPYLTVGLGLHVFQNAWAAILAYHAGILLLLRFAEFSDPIPFHRPASLWKMIGFAALGLTAGLAMYFLWPFVFVSDNLPGTIERWGLTRATWPFFIAYSALVNPWLEEIYWRGWLGSAAKRPILHDFVFGGFHLVILARFLSPIWLAVALFILAFSGWMWRQVDRVERSMLAASLFHMAADVSILIVVWSTV